MNSKQWLKEIGNGLSEANEFSKRSFDFLEDDVHKMKVILQQKEIDKRILDSCGTGSDCLRIMEEYDMLSETNTGYLIEVLKNINRNDLAEAVVDFEKQSANLLCPLHPVPYFIETTNCEKLKSVMKNEDLAILYGFPGSGKSQLALWYAKIFHQEHKQRSPVIKQFQCRSDDTLLASMKSLLEEWGIPAFNWTHDNSGYLGFIAGRVCERIQKMRKSTDSLLIFDDVHESSVPVVENFLALQQEKTEKTGRLKIIITTLHSNLEITIGSRGSKMHIKGMTDEEVERYFKQGSENIDGSILDLAKTVGYLPLFIVTAKSFMTATNITAEKYLQLLRSKALLRIGEEKIPNGYDKGSMKALDLVLSKLQMGLSDTAFHVLTFVPFLEHESIPIFLLENLLPKSLSPVSRQIEINHVITEIKKYSFGEVTGTDKDRIISFHAASRLALELRLNEGEDKTRVRTLLEILMSHLKVGIRRWTTLQINILLLRHAIKILQKADELFDTGDFEIRVLKCYVSCAIGATYRLQGVEDFLSNKFQKQARRLCFEIANVEDKIGDCDGDVNIEKESTHLYEGLIYAGTKNMSIFFVKNFVATRRRHDEDIEYLCEKGGFDEKDLPNKQIAEYIYESFCSKGLTLPVEMLKKFFLVELALYVIYNNGRNFYRLKKQLDLTGQEVKSSLTRCDSCVEQVQTRKRYQKEFLLAHYLNLLVQKDCNSFVAFQSTIVERHGLLYVDLRELKHNPVICDEFKILQLIEKTKKILDDKGRFYEFGVLAMADDFKSHHDGTCLKHLLKQYGMLHNLEKASGMEPPRYFYEGLKYAKQLQALIEDLKDCNALPGIHLQLAKYFMLQPTPENLHEAKEHLKHAQTTERENKGNILSHCMLQYRFHQIRCESLYCSRQNLEKASNLCNSFILELQATNRDKYLAKTLELKKSIAQKLQQTEHD